MSREIAEEMARHMEITRALFPPSKVSPTITSVSNVKCEFVLDRKPN